jgi:hypothetical protein
MAAKWERCICPPIRALHIEPLQWMLLKADELFGYDKKIVRRTFSHY